MKYFALVLVATIAMLGHAKAEEFSGFYAGVLLADTPAGNNDRLSAGVLSGYRFSLTDSVRLGVEAKAAAGMDSLATPFWSASAYGTMGLAVENTFFFAKAGVLTEAYQSWGIVTTLPMVGAGVEFAPNEHVVFRAEAAVSTNVGNSPGPVAVAEVAFGVLKYF